jgi:hypothetical protein
MPELECELQRSEGRLVQPLTRHDVVGIDWQLLERGYPAIPGDGAAYMIDYLLGRKGKPSGWHGR